MPDVLSRRRADRGEHRRDRWDPDAPSMRAGFDGRCRERLGLST
jgi:hypothetical protein